MGFREDFNKAREFEIALPGGFTLRTRKPDPLLALQAQTERLQPQAIKRYEELRAMPEPPENELRLMQVELALDARKFVLTILAECCVYPRLVATKEEAATDTSGNTICFDDLTADDIETIRAQLFKPLGLSGEQVMHLAPFRESGDAGEEGAALESAALNAS